MNIFWELHQHGKIAEASGKATRAQDRATQTRDHLWRVERRMERLSLACQAMWELLEERTDLTEAELLARMQEVDLRDGKADGKIGRQVLECPSCGRKANTARAACLYCGTDLSGHGDHVFG